MDANKDITCASPPPRWFVMRAYKCERRAEEDLLGDGGLEHFIPKRYAVRVYHGVKSRRLVPVIPSLVFVRSTRERLLGFKRSHPYLQFVMRPSGSGAACLTVPDGQMEDFIRVASRHDEEPLFLTPGEINVRRGTRVRIHGGHLDGVTGVLMQVKGRRDRRVVVMLEGVLSVAAEVHPDLLEVLR